MASPWSWSHSPCPWRPPERGDTFPWCWGPKLVREGLSTQMEAPRGSCGCLVQLPREGGLQRFSSRGRRLSHGLSGVCWQAGGGCQAQDGAASAQPRLQPLSRPHHL